MAIMLPEQRGVHGYDFTLNVRLIGPDFIAGNWLVSRLQNGGDISNRNTCKLQLSNIYVDDRRGKVQLWQDVSLSPGPRPWFINESDVLGDMYDAKALSVLDGVMLVYYAWSRASFERVRECCVQHQKVAPYVPILLVGCNTYRREVEYDMAVDFARERGVAVVEVSEGDGDNDRVEIALMMLVAQCLHSHEKSKNS